MSLRHAVKSLYRDLAGHYSARHFASVTPGPSRTRLVKDLTPRPAPGLPRKSTRKLLEVAPRDASSRFKRDTAPHWARRGKNPAARLAGEKEGRLRRTSLRSWKGVKNGKPKTRNDGVRTRMRTHPASRITPEFDFSTTPEALHTLPPTFSSPPLSPGLLQSVQDVLGPNARPTPIQSLSLKHLFVTRPSDAYRRFLLASETGSGKSLAYLLPMLHDLKETEHLRPRRTGPRALVLAPTHELSRQLTSFGKALVHHSRLRVQSASRANVTSRVSAAKMVDAFDGTDAEGEFDVRPGNGTGHALDVLVGTPAKLLEMGCRGEDKNFLESGEARRKSVRLPEVSLSETEWVVIDEADVLFDPDFIDQTLLLLSEIAAARGKPVPAISRDGGNKSQAPTPFDYPFNLVLTSATIPAALAAHLDAHHPTMTRLVSPRLHQLPTHLALEFAPYNSGNRNAAVLAKLKAVWRDDALAGRPRSRIVIFANTRVRAGEMGAYLSEHRVSCIVVTGQGIKGRGDGPGGSGQRVHGSNKHLAGFLKPMPDKKKSPSHSEPPCAGDKEGKRVAVARERPGQQDKSPRVLLGTSLLARGLDFDPSVSTSWEGVVFGKGGGRGAGKFREMREQLAALRARASARS
ncbi:P-loop containing nucleoside triphosphate hydrolase protein [Russula compacta]|nr:P-loop containing nucleoside triphosphate hydrolase protein [Russula compacta]